MMTVHKLNLKILLYNIIKPALLIFINSLKIAGSANLRGTCGTPVAVAVFNYSLKT